MTMFSDNRTPPEHDPFKDGEDIPNMKIRIQIFLGSRKMRI